MSRAALAGVALLVAQGALLGPLLARCSREPLSVRVAPGAPPGDGEVPASIEDRVAFTVDGTPTPRGAPVALAPGLHRAEWSLEYRGPFRRRVGRTLLAGPFQELSAPRCGLSVRIGQRFLDETVAPLAREIVARRLAGLSHWTIGAFRRITRFDLLWFALPGTRGMLHLTVGLEFSRAEAVAAIGAVPVVEQGALRVRSTVKARIDLKDWFLRQGARALAYLDLFDKDEAATDQVSAEVDGALRLLEGLSLPDLALPGGRLGVRFCDDRPIEITTGDQMEVPLALVFAHHDAPPISLVGPAAAPAPLTAPLGLTLDLDVLNGILHHLWRSGALDALLRDQGVADLFNTHPAVRDLLSLRVAELSFPIPPTLERGRDRTFSLGAELALTLSDGARATRARLFARLSFDVTTGPGGAIVASVTPDDLADDLAGTLALTCEPEPGLHTPCFADVVDAIARELRVNRRAVHAFVTDRFARTFDSFARGFRLAVEDREFRIEPAGVRTERAGDRAAIVHVDLAPRAERH